MKICSTIILTILLCGCTKSETQAELARIEAQQRQLRESQFSQFPYDFHYVGKETEFSSSFVLYRFNRATGGVDRITYFSGAPLSDGSIPPSVTRMNMLTGEKTFHQEKLLVTDQLPAPKP